MKLEKKCAMYGKLLDLGFQCSYAVFERRLPYPDTCKIG